jgi:hypothetical protein
VRQPEADVINRLEAGGVLQSSGQTLELTEEFKKRSATYIETIETKEESTIEDYVDIDGKSQWFERSAVAYAATLREFETGFSEEELVTVALSLVRAADPSANVATDSFLCLQGDELPGFLATSGAAIVFVTRPECEPCDRIREKLGRLIDDGTVPETLPLVEVSGPKYTDFLQEEYDVVGAPTLLLCKHGQIEMRLTGDKHSRQLRSDIGRVYSESSD